MHNCQLFNLNTVKCISIFVFTLLAISYNNVVKAQCPTQADLESGVEATYTFAGTCDITSTGDINITGVKTLTGGGTFNFSSSNNDLIIGSGGSLTIGGSGTNVNMTGTPNNLLTISTGGAITIDEGGILNTSSSGNFSLVVSGTLSVSGTVSSGTGTDINIDGGSAYIFGSSGLMDSDDDIKVFNGGLLEVDYGGTVTMTDELVTDDRSGASANGDAGAGTIIVNGSLSADIVTIFDTTPDSGIGGNGTLTFATTFTDGEANTDFQGCSATNPCTGTGETLPVEIISFSASFKKTNQVDISWQTASEINNDFFTLKKSHDAINWYIIGEVDGNGQSSTVINYAFEDISPLMGTSYYQLTQTDFDGTSETFDPIAVNNFSSNSLIPYPNPTTSEIHIDISEHELTNIEVVDFSGRSFKVNHVFHNNQLTIKMDGLSKGIYFLRIHTLSKIELRRFSKI
ncbi:MAG: T9SS type A sorting domain-containing protein [Reichenbachiella sp.]